MRNALFTCLLALSACGGGAAPDAASCKGICDELAKSAGGGMKLSAYEEQILGPLVADIRQGVRPFGEQGVGICAGDKKCETFVGTDAGELPPGKYMVRAELAVPNVGEPGTWKITFDTECTTTRTTPEGTSTSSTSNTTRSYDVRYSGKDRGYKLEPLRTIESPSTGGARSCTYKITAPHPDGDKVVTGSWSTPDADAS